MQIYNDWFDANDDVGAFIVRAAFGTPEEPTTMAQGTALGLFGFQGWVGPGLEDYSATVAGMRAQPTALWEPGNCPTDLELLACYGAGTYPGLTLHGIDQSVGFFGDLFLVNSGGHPVTIGGLTGYTWPTSHGVGPLTNDGTGNLSWGQP